MTLSIAIATQDMLAAEAKADRDAAAEALLAEVRRLVPEEVRLSEVDQGSRLSDDQLEIILRGGNPWEIGDLDEYEHNVRWQGEDYELSELRDQLDLDDDTATAWDDIEDDVREILRERDTSDLLGDLMRHTPALWLRYRLGDLDQEEMVDSIVDLLGGERTEELLANVDSVLANAAGYCEGVYLLVHTDKFDSIMQATVDVQQRKEAVKMTVTNPWLLTYSSGLGNGWADEINGTFTVDYDPDLLHVDTRASKSPGYSWTDEVAGICSPRHDTEITFTKESA